MAAKKDPTISTAKAPGGSPESGTAVSEGKPVDWHYEDASDKPDPDSVAQVQVVKEQ